MFALDMPFGLQLLQILPHGDFGHAKGLGQYAHAGAAFLLKPFQYLEAPAFSQQPGLHAILQRVALRDAG